MGGYTAPEGSPGPQPPACRSPLNCSGWSLFRWETLQNPPAGLLPAVTMSLSWGLIVLNNALGRSRAESLVFLSVSMSCKQPVPGRELGVARTPAVTTRRSTAELACRGLTGPRGDGVGRTGPVRTPACQGLPRGTHTRVGPQVLQWLMAPYQQSVGAWSDCFPKKLPSRALTFLWVLQRGTFRTSMGAGSCPSHLRGLHSIHPRPLAEPGSKHVQSTAGPPWGQGFVPRLPLSP